MNLTKSIYTIDLHAAGAPLRMVVSGYPQLRGTTLAEKVKDARQNYDDLRLLLLREPRGHDEAFGCILVEPTRSDCDLAVIFFDQIDYPTMCGHGTIASVTGAIVSGKLPMDSDRVYKVEVPCGVVEAIARINDQGVESISFTNVESFLHTSNLKVKLNTGETVKYDIAFGGSYFALVNAKTLRIEVCVKNLKILKSMAKEVFMAIDGMESDKPDPLSLSYVQFYELVDGQREQLYYRNTVISRGGQVDRSPCGSGTSAMLAMMFSKEMVGLGESVTSESILGTRFYGNVVENHQATGKIVPKITGSAYVTGFHNFVLDGRDLFAKGYSLGGLL